MMPASSASRTRARRSSPWPNNYASWIRKKYTQKVIARMLGVARETVRNWFLGHNGQKAKAPQSNDARVVVPKSERSKIAAMARKGKTQRQIAAEYNMAALVSVWAGQSVRRSCQQDPLAPARNASTTRGVASNRPHDGDSSFEDGV